MTVTMPQKEEKQPLPSPPGSTSSAEMALEDLTNTPAPALPPGVYFSPTKPESVLTYLNRWIAGHAMPDAEGWVNEHDVYGEHPDVLTGKYRPASTRNSEPSWWFLCHCKLQPTRGRARAGAANRANRQVATVGYWKLEQTSKEVKCAVSGRTLGFMRNFGFYLHGKHERPKTSWLMEEYTSVLCPEDGVARDDGKKVLPALHRLYITPRDPDKKEKNNKKRCRGDDGEEVDGGAPMRPGRVVVPATYFDAIAALMPPSSLRGVAQEQTTDAQESSPPPPPLPAVFDPYQGYDASSEDDHAMNVHEMMHAMPEVDPYQGYDASSEDDHAMNVHEMHAMPEVEQGNTDDSECPQDLLPANESTTAWQTMGQDDVFADSSWIDEHYMKPE